MFVAAFVALTLGVARAEPIAVGCVDLSITNGPVLDEATVRNLLHRARPCGEHAGIVRRGGDTLTLGQGPRLRQPELRYVLVAAPLSDAEDVP